VFVYGVVTSEWLAVNCLQGLGMYPYATQALNVVRTDRTISCVAADSNGLKLLTLRYGLNCLNVTKTSSGFEGLRTCQLVHKHCCHARSWHVSSRRSSVVQSNSRPIALKCSSF
jgi:hypothetical protein